MNITSIQNSPVGSSCCISVNLNQNELAANTPNHHTKLNNMNFLAHIYLSGDDPLITLGNFIGDFVKGNQANVYPEKVRNGISLHRAIDKFTDTHDVVLRSKIRLRPDYRHYAPVIVDVYYDHFLSKYWKEYHDTPLSEYTDQFYEMIKDHQDLLPERASHMFNYMRNDNWLLGYSQIIGIEQALGGMSRRTKFDSGMERAGENLRADYESFKSEFEEFFPDLISYAASLRSSWE
jgi:acyl carrier protein phosphodiesterase